MCGAQTHCVNCILHLLTTLLPHILLELSAGVSFLLPSPVEMANGNCAYFTYHQRAEMANGATELSGRWLVGGKAQDIEGISGVRRGSKEVR